MIDDSVIFWFVNRARGPPPPHPPCKTLIEFHFAKCSFPFLAPSPLYGGPQRHGKSINLTAKEKPQSKKKKTHGKKNNHTAKRKRLAAKRITSRQKEKPHGKKNNLTAKRKRLTAKRITSRQKEKDSGCREDILILISFAVSLFLFAVYFFFLS